MQLIREIMAEWGLATEETKRIALQLLRQSVGPDGAELGHSAECQDQLEPGGEGILQCRE